MADGVDYADNGKNNFKVKTGEEVDLDASTNLRQEYGYSQIFLPAIYGTDTITNTEDLIFVRVLKNASSTKRYYIDNVKYEGGQLVQVKYGEQGYNYALNGITYADENDKVGTLQNTTDSIIGNPNQASKFRFTASGNDKDYAGTYYLEYLVYSKTVKTRYGTLKAAGTDAMYSITILNTEISTKESDLKLEIENLTAMNVLSMEIVVKGVNVSKK